MTNVKKPILKEISSKQLQLLHLMDGIADRNPQGLSAREIAREFWFDSASWNKSYKNGSNSVARGKILQMTMGSMLQRLKKRGWVRQDSYSFRWSITDCGMEMVNEG